MKRVPLRRITLLKSKGTSLKKSPINKVSDKQKVELKNRHDLKAELIAQYGEHCMTCHDANRDWRGLSLSHIIALSNGGKTCRENCLIECYICHEFYEKKEELRGKILPPNVK
jgi:hypothetical protein